MRTISGNMHMQETGYFTDICEEHNQTGPTTEGRRVDHVWGNPAARRLVSKVKVHQYFSVHKTIEVVLNLAVFKQKAWKREGPKALDLTARQNVDVEALRQLTQSRYDDARRKARSGGTLEERRAGLDGMLEVIAERAVTYLQKRAGRVVDTKVKRGMEFPVRKVYVVKPEKKAPKEPKQRREYTGDDERSHNAGPGADRDGLRGSFEVCGGSCQDAGVGSAKGEGVETCNAGGGEVGFAAAGCAVDGACGTGGCASGADGGRREAIGCSAGRCSEANDCSEATNSSKWVARSDEGAEKGG